MNKVTRAPSCPPSQACQPGWPVHHAAVLNHTPGLLLRPQQELPGGKPCKEGLKSPSSLVV